MGLLSDLVGRFLKVCCAYNSEIQAAYQHNLKYSTSLCTATTEAKTALLSAWLAVR